jgi:hypothetical protein
MPGSSFDEVLIKLTLANGLLPLLLFWPEEVDCGTLKGPELGDVSGGYCSGDPSMPL